MKTGTELIAEERIRQMSEEGWTLEHDAIHIGGELSTAAACYAELGRGKLILPSGKCIPEGWPWESGWWKPTTRIRDLVKAGALIAAEIDRLQAKDS